RGRGARGHRVHRERVAGARSRARADRRDPDGLSRPSAAGCAPVARRSRLPDRHRSFTHAGSTPWDHRGAMAPEPVLARLVGGPLDGMAVGLAEASTLIELPALPSLLDRPLPLTTS